ncbi:MAG: hypothetical protein OEW27_16835, partial [Aquincola sp.]|nr:hypothetical protein [Aquincola sp.]
SDVELIKAVRKPAEKLNSWEAYQRGMWHMLRHDPDSLRMARTFFEMAVERDPTFASPLSELARTYTQASAVFSDYPVEEALNHAELAVRQAIALDREHPGARATLGQVLLLRGNLTGAVQEAERSLALASSCAEGYGVKGAALLALANFAEARNALHACIRIDPIGHPTPVRLSQIAAAHYFEADYDLAAGIARDVIQRSPTNPNGYRVLAASLGQLGELRAANEAWTQYVDLNPSSIELQIRHCPPWRLPAQHEHLQQGLRLAGWMD